MSDAAQTVPLRRPTHTAGQRLRAWLGRDAMQGYLMVAPAFLWIVLLLGYPFVLAIWLSMTNKTVGNPGEFVGLRNFIIQWDSEIFRRAFANTFIYTAITTVVKFAVGLGLALLLNQPFFGRRFARSALLLPWIVPTVLSTMAFYWMFDPNLSAVNWTLRNLGLIQKNIPWLTDPTMALVSVMIVNCWRGIPFFAITILAGLQTVPQELYEAAALDGANPLQKLRRITLPMIVPILSVVVIVSVIGTFSDVQVVASLTGGGPQNTTHVLATLSYRVGLQSGQLGQGASIAMYMLPFLVAMILFELWNIRRSAQ